MKKISNKIIFALFVAFFGIIGVHASQKYFLYECNENISDETILYHHLANHDMDTVCRLGAYNGTITLNSHYEGTTDLTSLGKTGGGESLKNADNFLDHYPNFIVVTGKNLVDWHGADTIEKARSIFHDKMNSKGIFINAEYLNELQSFVPEFSYEAYKTCEYNTGLFEGTAVNIYGVDRNKLKNEFSLVFNKDGYYLRGALFHDEEKNVVISAAFNSGIHYEIKSNECPNIHICYKFEYYDNGNQKYPVYFIYKDSLNSLNQCKDMRQKDLIVNSSGTCSTYTEKLYSLKGYYNTSQKTEYNKEKSEFVDLCKSVLTQSDATDPCVIKCMTLNQDIAEIESTDIKTNDCSLSTKLIIWIENILRWVKYIVPVIIIVLSILDFIKAMASEKDDDMKKAQKHFVTRLIIAVLIFIMPLIIEFVLDKMGFSADSCGISNLGLGE